MAIKASGIIIAISYFFALFNGKMAELSNAAIEGGNKAISLTLSLLGMMCLWSGIMKVAEQMGVLKHLSNLLSPILRLIFPDAWRRKKGISEISAAIIANILGIGNAATPLAVSAMKSLSDGKSDIASDDMVTFTVLGTAFPSIIPTTVISLRATAGSKDPFDILPAVWITSIILSLFAITLSRLFRTRGRHE